MAEFCYDCFCELWDTSPKKKELVFTDHLNLCEGCNEYKETVIAYKKDIYAYRFRHLITALKVLTTILLLPLCPLIIWSRKHQKKPKKRSE